MNKLSDINAKLFHFSLSAKRKSNDDATLEDLLAQGADPTTVVNGKPIVLNFWENGKTDLFQRALPLCDFSVRFGGRSLLGYATLGAMVNFDTPNLESFQNYIRLFVSFVQHGANPWEPCRTNMVVLNTPCVDLLFDALRSCGGNNGDLLLQLLQHKISPQMEYWHKAGINLDQDNLSEKLPICFNRWWKEMQHMRQNERICASLNSIHFETQRIETQPRQRKI